MMENESNPPSQPPLPPPPQIPQRPFPPPSHEASTTNTTFGTGNNNNVDTSNTSSVSGVSISSSSTSASASSFSAPPPLPPRCVLEDFTRCSESHLWKLMMSFYDRKGVESWSQGIVPHFITCNAFIGRSYAQVLQGFIRDCARKTREEGPTSPLALDPTEPLYIIELGAGSGKFSFFMLKALAEMRELLDFPFEKIVYVMTDFTQNNFKFWESHPGLRPFIEQGSLDLAIFDAVHDPVIHLAHAKRTLAPGTVKNPICIVANYLFDTLCHDIFQVEGGMLKEGLISVGSRKQEEPDPLDPEIIKRFDNHFRYRPIDADYYSQLHARAHAEGKGEEADSQEDQLHFRRILNWYHQQFRENPLGASFLFPIGALRALRRLTALSEGRALVISGDKGNNHAEQFKGLMDPHIAVHGSFSVMVNYHAIGTYFISRGGFALHNPQEEASLKVSAFVLGGEDARPEDDLERWVGEGVEALGEERARAFPALRAAFYNAVDRFGPNDFFVMQKCMKEDSPNPTLKAVLALLKLGDWDPDVFYKFRDTILNQVPTSGQKLRNDLCRGIPRVWENYYLLDRDKDIAFEIGRFYYGIREYEKALGFYRESSTSIGEHHVTFHNMGLCHYSMGNYAQALEYFNHSLAFNKDYEKARSWRQKVLQEMNPSPSPPPNPNPNLLPGPGPGPGLQGPVSMSSLTAQVERVDKLSLQDTHGPQGENEGQDQNGRGVCMPAGHGVESAGGGLLPPASMPPPPPQPPSSSSSSSHFG